MEFSRQEYWSGLPFPSPGYLPNPRIEPASLAMQADSLPLGHRGSLLYHSYVKMLTDEEKENDAYAFAKKYKNDVVAFMNYMCESAFSVKGDFKDSWEFIEKDMRSIERYTNLPICLESEMQEKETAIE